MATAAGILKRINRLNRTARPTPTRPEKTLRRVAQPRRMLRPAEARAAWLEWFAAQGWTPFPFQVEAWEAFARQESGLIAVATGSGKTYAAVGGPLLELVTSPPPPAEQRLSILYISPLKALVRDIAQAIAQPLRELDWPIEVEVRTGDTSQASRRRLKQHFPDILVTTPESLAILMTEPEWQHRMAGLRAIVLDEWHELLQSKRGSLLELTMARLRAAVPSVRTWALSATIGTLDSAAQAAVGRGPYRIIRADLPRAMAIRTIIPPDISECPWFGYSGLRLLPDVARTIDPRHSTLIFTNTRSHAERWYQALLAHRPDWSSMIALHHGSLDQETRQEVEEGVKSGRLRVVVATSSLDLGVDFPRVERVIQIGSARSVARAVQRAGRAFHRPGEGTELWLCPTHLMELIEAAALREAVRDGALEARQPLAQPMDVLVQFLLNSAYGEGFDPEDVWAQVQSAYSFRHLTRAEFDWALTFVQTGGGSLEAYPSFHKLHSVDARCQFANSALAREHKMNIGTIVSDGGVPVRFLRGGNLGVVDEAFVSKLRRGSLFQFAGKTLEFVHLRDMVAYVKAAKPHRAMTSVWTGTGLPLSVPFSTYLRREIDRLHRVAVGDAAPGSPELAAVRPMAVVQQSRSHIPRENQTLVEASRSREGCHLFLYTWEGAAVNEGLGHVAAFRLARMRPNTISVAANHHGIEWLSTEPLGEPEEIYAALTGVDQLEADIHASLNYPALAKTAFREIARVAGLIQQGTPYARKTARHLQMSASLLFDVFREHEPDHPLLRQAYREVSERQLELGRLRSVMQAIGQKEFVYRRIERLTPFAFPLYVERIRSRLSTEQLEQRIARLRREAFAD